MAFTEAGHGLLVFLGFERAGGVDEHPARLEQAGGDGEQLQLVTLVGFQVFGLTVPADIRLAADDAGARAGRVDEDGVERRGQGGGELGEVGAQGVDRPAQTETGEVLAQQAVAPPVGFDRDERAAGRQQFGQMGGLAAQTGTAVEHPAAGRQGWDEQAGQLGRLVLHLELPFHVAGQGGDRAGEGGHDQRGRAVAAVLDDNAALLEPGAQQGAARAPGVGPQGQRRLGVVAAADLPGERVAEAGLPALHQPVRMVEQGWFGRGQRLRGGQGGAFADHGAQQAVDEAHQPARLAGRLEGVDRGVDRRRLGDA